MKLCIMLSW